MTSQINESAAKKPLRLWPGAVLAVLVVVFRVLVPAIAPEATLFGLPVPMVAVMAALAGALLILLWWLFLSRAPWLERVLAILVMAVAAVAIRPLLDASMRGLSMGFMYFFNAAFTMTVALVIWAAATRRQPAGRRRATMIAAIVLACGAWTLVRTGGISGDGDQDLHWRWTPTPEQKLMAQTRDEPMAPPPPAAAPSAPVPSSPAPTTPAEPAPDTRTVATAPANAAPTVEPVRGAATGSAGSDPSVGEIEWAGFRGATRDSVARVPRIDTDWARTPPVELWRRPVGPAWSSFAVAGDRIYTQEQRGEEEVVSCYRLTTGEPIWRHKDPIRFYEANAGPGPRGTPTLHNGRVYTMGATGVLNALDAATGARFWSRDTVKEADKQIPEWGIASSPLVYGDLLIVAVAGRLVAYDIQTGKQRWIGEQGGGGYSSPHLATIDGVPQILLARGSRTISVSPADGKMLWEHNWIPAVAIVQPTVTPDGGVLIASHDGMAGNGMRRVDAKRGPNGWTVQEKWTSRGLKPYFNDTVVHNGHAFGFDGSILSCIDVGTGDRKWKGGRYGSGQMLLLADQDLLLVLAEDGDIALVKAVADGHAELARIPAIEGKTWNHPVVVRDILLVRNGAEMVAFRLPAAR